MKRIVSLLLIIAVLMVPTLAFAEDTEADMVISVLSDNKDVEVGDQFIVNFMIEEEVLPYLTFRINGTFDPEVAEVVAPVYTNEVLGILTNKFDNEEGTFTFEGYDQTISGTDEAVICSILFEAKSAGVLNVTLADDCMLGKANENAFYVLDVNGNEFTVSEDTDGEEVSIIEDPEPQTPYDEVIMGHPAEKGIVVMYKLGALEGIADETIDTERSITRGEFATMLAKICKLQSTGQVEAFIDVPADSFMYESLKVLKARKIAEGDGEGGFMPDANITRQDAFSLIFRTMVKMNKVDSEIDSEAYLGDFADKDEIAPYAVDAFAGMFRAKLIDDTKCDPTGEMTLGEACHILNKLAEFNILVSRN